MWHTAYAYVLCMHVRMPIAIRFGIDVILTVIFHYHYQPIKEISQSRLELAIVSLDLLLEFTRQSTLISSTHRIAVNF